MKWMIAGVASIGFAILSLSIPAPIFTTEALANRMNGVGNCSGGTCTKVTCPAGTCSKAGTKDAIDISSVPKPTAKSSWKYRRPPRLAASFISVMAAIEGRCRFTKCFAERNTN
jgi:hypothetical protein